MFTQEGLKTFDMRYQNCQAEPFAFLSEDYVVLTK